MERWGSGRWKLRIAQYLIDVLMGASTVTVSVETFNLFAMLWCTWVTGKLVLRETSLICGKFVSGFSHLPGRRRGVAVHASAPSLSHCSLLFMPNLLYPFHCLLFSLYQSTVPPTHCYRFSPSWYTTPSFQFHFSPPCQCTIHTCSEVTTSSRVYYLVQLFFFVCFYPGKVVVLANLVTKCYHCQNIRHNQSGQMKLNHAVFGRMDVSILTV